MHRLRRRISRLTWPYGPARRQGLAIEKCINEFDALDARSNFEPIMQSVRDLNKLDDA